MQHIQRITEGKPQSQKRKSWLFNLPQITFHWHTFIETSPRLYELKYIQNI